MEFKDVIAARRSIRKYKSKAVPQTRLLALQQALRTAPSGSNRQDFAFIFVTDPQTRARIAAEAGHQDFLAQAPLLVVAVCKPGESFNAAIAVDHMVLAATDQGLGSCWVGWFEREPVKRILGIPDSCEVPILVAVGYADEQPEARARKPLEKLIMKDRYVAPAE